MNLYKVKKSKIDNQGVYAAKDIRQEQELFIIKENLSQKKKQKEILNMIMIRQFIYSI